MRERNPCVYILAGQTRGTLYLGVTSDLRQRLWQHRHAATAGFASRHRVHRLVHVEFFPDMSGAIAREKQLKNWRRAWKINLVEQANPDWRDLAVAWGLSPALRPGC